MDLSYETIDLIMNYPCKAEDLCAVVRKTCKSICIQITQDLDAENITDFQECPSESELESEQDY